MYVRLTCSCIQIYMYIYAYVHCRLDMFLAGTWQIIRIYICPYVMRTPQRMNLKHQNVLELLGVTQGNITCLVMPSVQRQSIQVCMWLRGSIIKVHTYLHFVVTIAFSVPLPLSLGRPQFTVCVATWSRILHVKRNLWGWWLHMYFYLVYVCTITSLNVCMCVCVPCTSCANHFMTRRHACRLKRVDFDLLISDLTRTLVCTGDGLYSQ